MPHYRINNRDIKTRRLLIDGVMYDKFPTLYSLTKTGKVQMWTIYVLNSEDAPTIRRVSGQENGKKQTYVSTIIKGKNIGKKNETTPFHQAIFDAFSMWTKQHDKGYTEVRPNPNKVRESIGALDDAYRPMLAHPYSKHKKKLKSPCALSYKLDGIRAVARVTDGVVRLFSRNNKEFLHMNHIRDAIMDLVGYSGVVLDGELYTHELPFTEISSICRQKTKRKDDSMMEYWVFDIVDPNKTYKQRLEQLKTMFGESTPSCLRLVGAEELQEVTDESIRKYHNKYVANGFEGLIARNWDGLYLVNHRSHDLLKYKDFQDEEFEIIDAVCSRGGTEDGAICWICVTPDKDKFSVRPRGSMESRRRMWAEFESNPEKFVGQMLTVRFQDKTEGRDSNGPVPRFPVGIEIRNYE